MTDTTRYGVKTPDVMHETIDGEVIAIHLGSGNYYSLRSSSAAIWGLLSENGPIAVGEIVDRLEPMYTSSRPELEAAVQSFVATLVDEGLVGGTNVPSESARPIPAVDGTSRVAFDTPKLERYTDMQDLVLLDPVHQVDETGWPRTREQAEADAATAGAAS